MRLLVLLCTRLQNDHLIVSSCLLPAYQVLVSFFIPLTAFDFQSRLQALLILQHSCYSVSFDKVYKERNKLVVILFTLFVFWWFGFPLVTKWCLQAIPRTLLVAWILGSTQTSLQHPLSAVFTNEKWHLSSPVQKKITYHIIAEWKRVSSL